MQKNRLTPSQQRFCDEWLKDHNGTRAYRAAYPRVKKDQTAAQAASRLLRNVKVRSYIERRQDEMAAKYRIDQERILKEEACIAFSDVSKLFKGGEPLDPDELPMEIKRAISSLVTKKLPDGGKGYSYRFWDKGGALDRISKHLGLYERNNHQMQPSLQEVLLFISEVSPELAKAVKRKLKETLENDDNQNEQIGKLI